MLSCPLSGVPEYSMDLIGVEVGIHRYMLDTYENENLANKRKGPCNGHVHLALHNLDKATSIQSAR
jgi:hypothetical protein